MTFETMINELRLELDDPDKSRWTDDQLLIGCKRAVRRLQAILTKHDIAFAKSFKDFTTVPATEAYKIGDGEAVDISDLGAPIDLYRTDTDEVITHVTADQYTRLHNPSAHKYWMYYNDSIYLAGTISTATALRFWYWPMLTQTITTATTVPHGDKMADIILDYTAARMKNIDEMNITMDMQLLGEMENHVLAFCQRFNPIMGPHEGPMGVE